MLQAKHSTTYLEAKLPDGSRYAFIVKETPIGSLGTLQESLSIPLQDSSEGSCRIMNLEWGVGFSLNTPAAGRML